MRAISCVTCSLKSTLAWCTRPMSRWKVCGTIFIAQLYGIDLTLSQQILLDVTMVLTSKGATGVPGFAIITLSATLASAGLPLEAVALVAGIFRVIESGTTTLNVLGNAIAPLVIARWEGVALKGEGGPLPLRN